MPLNPHGVGILEADSELTTRFPGRPKTDEQFGSKLFFQALSYNHLLGSIDYKHSLSPIWSYAINNYKSRVYATPCTKHKLYNYNRVP